jgi:hypothetical protein
MKKLVPSRLPQRSNLLKSSPFSSRIQVAPPKKGEYFEHEKSPRLVMFPNIDVDNPNQHSDGIGIGIPSHGDNTDWMGRIPRRGQSSGTTSLEMFG